MSARKSLIERFWASVEKAPGDECWLWTGTLQSSGYGVIYGEGRKHGAHRLSWRLANGRAPTSHEFICHRCDNPLCVNPAHLWLGTARENNLDRDAKGRNAHRLKTHCPRGHAYDEANTKYYKGGRYCRACNFAAHARLEERRRGARAYSPDFTKRSTAARLGWERRKGMA